MRRVLVKCHGFRAGVLEEDQSGEYTFVYDQPYQGEPVSLAMPFREEPYRFKNFPPFFDGILPEGFQLESLLFSRKLDSDDYLGQLLVIGADTVGSITVEPLP